MRIVPEHIVLPSATIVREGAASELLKECAAFGGKGLVVHGASFEDRGGIERITAGLGAEQQVGFWRHTGGEPTLDDLAALLSELRAREYDWVAGVGGGSVIDVAKAGAGLRNAPLGAVEYHNGAPLPGNGLPFIAVPTTAGTGTEATIVAVLSNLLTGEKKSFRHHSLMARLVVLDSDLLMDCPLQVTASAGMDAFVQAAESFFSRGATWLSSQFSLEAAVLIAGNLESVMTGGGSAERTRLLVGSYFAGVALSNARLGLVHGLAHPLGIRYNQPHGLVCGACFRAVMEFNREAAADKYEELVDRIEADPVDLVDGWFNRSGLVSPFRGCRIKDEEGIVAETLASGSTAANPRAVTADDVRIVLERVFEKME